MRTRHTRMNVREQLELFNARVEELRNSRLIRKGFNPAITISWDRMQGLRFQSEEPDEEDLRSFLLTFRQFISEGEPVFLNRICNLCLRSLTSDELKGYLVESREAWRQAQRSSGVKLIHNNQELTPEYVTDLWINGYYFHSDGDKLSRLKQLLPHEGMLVRNQFLSYLVDATRQVIYVGNVVTIALKENLFKF